MSMMHNLNHFGQILVSYGENDSNCMIFESNINNFLSILE